jgi:hypothetical protein
LFRGIRLVSKPALGERGMRHTVRIPANKSLERDIAELLTRPEGRPSHKPVVWYKVFLYQAASWRTARRVVAKVEFHFGEPIPRVGFIVTELETDRRAVVRFYNRRGAAEQRIKDENGPNRRDRAYNGSLPGRQNGSPDSLSATEVRRWSQTVPGSGEFGWGSFLRSQRSSCSRLSRVRPKKWLRSTSASTATFKLLFLIPFET